MRGILKKRFIRWTQIGVLVLIAFDTARVNGQAVDLDSNGMSDVWEFVYNATSLSPSVDTDGDGISNYQESVAGTDPTSPGSVPRILASGSTTNIHLSMTAALGKLYQLQSSQLSGGSPVWTNEVSITPRSGNTVSFNMPVNQNTRIFRMAISDEDTDGDGVNDWEEYKLGLDPLQTASSGQLDTNGAPVNDHYYVVAKLASQNVVTLYASDPTASQPDPGQPALSLGSYTVARDGFPLNDLTVNLVLGGPGSGFATEGVDHEVITRPVTLPAGASTANITLTPMANTNLVSPIIAMLKELPGTGYTIGANSNASVVIYPSPTPSGTGLTGQYFTNSSTTYGNAINFHPTNLFLTRVDSAIDLTNTFPFPSTARFTVRWTGQVQPQYSENYFFEVRSDDGVKLWVNNQLLIDAWQSQGFSTRTNAISLQAGLRYNIKLDYLFTNGTPRTHLYWYSESQPRQIIPSKRLYPSTNAASAVTSPLTAVGFLGQPFSFSVTGANSSTNYTANGLPPGLNFNSTNGVISGVPALAGNFQITLTASNVAGLGASVLLLTVFDTGSAVTREVWTGVPGTNVSDVPASKPTTSGAYGTLQGIPDYGDNYAERIRGYLTVPTTGSYYFWLAASDSAELWISNDSEPANKVRRAYVLPNGTAPLQWNLQPSQKSPWLSLIAGQRYYIEVLHKAGAGAGDNWAVSWLLDPTGTNNTPTGIVPNYTLSRHFDKPPAFIPGTLYGANMLAQSGILSSGVGSSTMRISADGLTAIVKFNYSGLSSPVSAKHIHADTYQNKNSQGAIICDFDEPGDVVLQPDGSYVWTISPKGGLSTADILELIKEGKSYLNIHTTINPNGEINGHFTPAVGAQLFVPPPLPPVPTDDHTSAPAAARFLIQSTFGPNSAEIAAVQSLGYESWIDNQFQLPISGHLSNVLAMVNSDPTAPYSGNMTFNTWWRQAVNAPDQLRQRVAFALSEIMVVSENGVLDENSRALSSYYDTLLQHSFGNYRELLEAVTLHPAMGLYLDMRRNDKGNITLGTHPNENYAREILQLFSIGLNRMWPDGTLVMSSTGDLVPTYTQDEILGFARVFTGWDYYQVNPTNAGRLPLNFTSIPNYTNSMVLVPTRHELGTKRVLDNVILPAASGPQADVSTTNYDQYGLNDLELAHDSIFRNENTGPFICRQLIQRLVTSHPSRDYLYRVVQKFNDNGSGVRGDMKAVIKAILLDYEARSSASLAQPTFGKQREPLCRVTAPARAFPPTPLSGTYNQTSNRTITVTTPAPHRLNNNDTIFIGFTDTSGKAPPPSQGYSATVSGPTTFTLNASGLVAATYNQTDNIITVTNSGHGLSVGYPVYLSFVTGGALDGLYTVDSVPTNSLFTVIAGDSSNRVGTCVFPKLVGGGYTQVNTNINVSIAGTHGLSIGDNVYINFTTGSAVDGQYQVVAVPDITHFVVYSSVSNSLTESGVVVFPMVVPPLFRSGNALIQFGTWNMNATDNGSSSSLSQTPLNSPTVFNFFLPDYKFPGILASAGLTTPEFQLTSDTEVILQMNFLANGTITGGNNSSSNSRTNGMTSFSGGNGSIVLDFGPWMTPANTSNTGLFSLVDQLNILLCGGQLSATAKTNIVNYVSTVTNSNPNAHMRDRVSATIHLIINSPEFTIQK